MASDFKKVLQNRRSYYDIGPESPLSQDEIRELVDFAVLYTPSAFNSQSARVVVLFGASHQKLWDLVREALRPLVSAEAFVVTDAKVKSFAAGHGTILFFEDQATIEGLQTNFPLYKDDFPGYSANSAGMLQLVVWAMLRDAGLGASLQHYGNLIEKSVTRTWGLDPNWRLVAQMPFGKPLSEPGEKDQLPLDERVKVFS